VTAVVIQFPARIQQLGWLVRGSHSIAHYVVILPPTRYRGRRMRLACGGSSKGVWWLNEDARHCRRCALLAPRRFAEAMS
jgi:hypothetical protein